MKTNLNP